MKHEELSMQDVSLNSLRVFSCAQRDWGFRRAIYREEPEPGLVVSSNCFSHMGRKDTAHQGSGFPAVLIHSQVSVPWDSIDLWGPVRHTARCYCNVLRKPGNRKISHPTPYFLSAAFPASYHLSLMESLISCIDFGSLWAASSHCFANLSQAHKQERREKIEREKWLRHSSVTQKAVMSEFRDHRHLCQNEWDSSRLQLVLWFVHSALFPGYQQFPAVNWTTINPFPLVGFQTVIHQGGFSLAGRRFQYFIIEHLVWING